MSKRPRRTIFYVNKLQVPKWYSVLLALGSIFDAIVTIVTFGYVGASTYMNLFSIGMVKYVVPASNKAMSNGYPAQAWSGSDIPPTVVVAFRKTNEQ